MEISLSIHVRVVSGNVDGDGLYGSRDQQVGKTPVALKIAGQVPGRTIQEGRVPGDTGVGLIARTYDRSSARPVSGDHFLGHLEPHQRLIAQEDQHGATLIGGELLECLQPESKGVGETEAGSIVEDRCEPNLLAQHLGGVIIHCDHNVPTVEDLALTAFRHYVKHVRQ